MIGETIRTEFEALKNDFETIRQQIEDDVVRTELYKGEFYEPKIRKQSQWQSQLQ